MRRHLLAVIVLSVTLGACTMPMTGGTASPTPTATPTPSLRPTPIPSPTVVNGRVVVSNLDPDGATTVAGILFPASAGVCGVNGTYDSCHVTAGLAQRLDANPLKPAEPLCRCQNTYQSRTITSTPLPESNPGAIAHVVFDFGSGWTVRLDFTVVQTLAGWYASDTSCTGQDT